MKVFIIDTFNLIYKEKESTALFKSNVNAGISSIAAKISVYAQKYKSYKFRLILDGSNYSPTAPTPNISFTESGAINADNKIRDIIKKSKNLKHYTVVSSDTEVHNFAKINACNVITSEDFLKKITPVNASNINSKSSKRNKSEKPTRPTKKEYNELLKAFKG